MYICVCIKYWAQIYIFIYIHNMEDYTYKYMQVLHGRCRYRSTRHRYKYTCICMYVRIIQRSGSDIYILEFSLLQNVKYVCHCICLS